MIECQVETEIVKVKGAEIVLPVVASYRITDGDGEVIIEVDLDLLSFGKKQHEITYLKAGRNLTDGVGAASLTLEEKQEATAKAVDGWTAGTRGQGGGATLGKVFEIVREEICKAAGVTSKKARFLPDMDAAEKWCEVNERDFDKLHKGAIAAVKARDISDMF